MKKMLLAAITGMMILAASTCSATVPADQLVLGGIQYGAPISAVESAYGMPRKSEREMKPYGERLNTNTVINWNLNSSTAKWSKSRQKISAMPKQRRVSAWERMRLL